VEWLKILYIPLLKWIFYISPCNSCGFLFVFVYVFVFVFVLQKCRYLWNQESYHRTAGVKMTRNLFLKFTSSWFVFVFVFLFVFVFVLQQQTNSTGRVWMQCGNAYQEDDVYDERQLNYWGRVQMITMNTSPENQCTKAQFLKAHFHALSQFFRGW